MNILSVLYGGRGWGGRGEECGLWRRGLKSVLGYWLTLCFLDKLLNLSETQFLLYKVGLVKLWNAWKDSVIEEK